MRCALREIIFFQTECENCPVIVDYKMWGEHRVSVGWKWSIKIVTGWKWINGVYCSQEFSVALAPLPSPSQPFSPTKNSQAVIWFVLWVMSSFLFRNEKKKTNYSCIHITHRQAKNGIQVAFTLHICHLKRIYPLRRDKTFWNSSAPRHFFFFSCCQVLLAGWSNHQTDTQTGDTDLCDLCRGRHPWSQDGRAVICSPWWLEDEAGVKERKKGRKEGEAKRQTYQRSREKWRIQAGGK